MQIPPWLVGPFVAVVLCVALLPSLTPRLWRSHRNLVLAALSLPMLCFTLFTDYHSAVRIFVDYVTFICYLGAVYSIGEGLVITGVPKANPVVNLIFMAAGAVLSNLIGTLGASMLFIRPLLRSNRGRKHAAHVVVFFIFIVCNAGGLLTPLGDPPLFLGYLMGVPFWWPLKLFPIWVFVVTSLLGVFAALDAYFYLDDPDFRGPLQSEARGSFSIVGKWNLALIPLVVVGLILPQMLPAEFDQWRRFFRIFILLSTIFFSRRLTPRQVNSANLYNWEPFREVALVFAAIFATMTPAIEYLQRQASLLEYSGPSSFYWKVGLLSSIFDNTPTYAFSFALAQGIERSFALLTLPNGIQISEPLLMALSCGAVFFGGMTYLGNWPNLLVKAIAEDEKVSMPSFFSYIAWSLVLFAPVLYLTARLFFEF